MKVSYFVSLCILVTIVISIIGNMDYVIPTTNLWKTYKPARNHIFGGIRKQFDMVRFKVPQCKNLLSNMTMGMWVRDMNVPEKLRMEKERAYKQVLLDFWYKRGIMTRLWRPDLKCGYLVKQERPINSSWFSVGSWCNKDSETPCCDNIHRGMCSRPSEKSCKCPTCTDMRDYQFEHSIVWQVKDKRCIWQNYSSEDACHIIATSPFRELHFVGDSLIRNMLGAFLMLIKNDPVQGSWKEVITNKNWIRTCSGPQRFFWKECRQVPKLSLICNNFTYERITVSQTAMKGPSNNFNRLLSATLGKPRSLLIFGVGLHNQCDPQTVISEYLLNAIKKKQILNRRQGAGKSHKQNMTESLDWPKIIFVSPPRTGHLKPSAFWKTQNNEKCGKFHQVLKHFCNFHGIPYLDIMTLTKNLFSADGTHYTYKVNYMKVQILLNYLSSTYSNEIK